MAGTLALRCGLLVPAALLVGCTDVVPLGKGLEATARCTGVAATMSFDPEGRVEVRLDDHEVAWADADGREIDFGRCTRIETQRSWFTGFPYARAGGETELACRFRREFFIHVHPVYTSESGELSPDGSAVYLVVGKRRRLVASASVTKGSQQQSSLAYSRRYCRAS